MKYALLILILAACGKSPTYVQGIVTEEITEYVTEFEDTFDVEVNFEVVVVKKFTNAVPEGIAAVCINYGGFKRVEILDTNGRGYWRLFVFHELGHCALGLEHYENGRDIMNAKTNPFIADRLDDIYIPQMLSNYNNGRY